MNITALIIIFGIIFGIALIRALIMKKNLIDTLTFPFVFLITYAAMTYGVPMYEEMQTNSEILKQKQYAREQQHAIKNVCARISDEQSKGWTIHPDLQELAAKRCGGRISGMSHEHQAYYRTLEAQK